MKKILLLIITLFIFPLTVTLADVNYALLYEYLNDIRTEAGVPRVDINDDLVSLAKLQADAMIATNIYEHYVYDSRKGEPFKRIIGKTFGAEKHYIDLRMYELYAVRNKISLLNTEWELAHAFDYSSPHYSKLIMFSVEAMGAYVAETKDQYFMVVYLLLRYYI